MLESVHCIHSYWFIWNTVFYNETGSSWIAVLVLFWLKSPDNRTAEKAEFCLMKNYSCSLLNLRLIQMEVNLWLERYLQLFLLFFSFSVCPWNYNGHHQKYSSAPPHHSGSTTMQLWRWNYDAGLLWLLIRKLFQTIVNKSR